MPSIPTSLIVVGLVLAWLVVLVPMVAKRRERVPESEEDGAGFRVLRRASALARRRPVLSRTAVPADDGYGYDADADIHADDLMTDEDMAMVDEYDEDQPERDRDEYADDGTAGYRTDDDEDADRERVPAAEYDDEVDDLTTAVTGASAEVGVMPVAGDVDQDTAALADAADEWAAEHPIAPPAARGSATPSPATPSPATPRGAAARARLVAPMSAPEEIYEDEYWTPAPASANADAAGAVIPDEQDREAGRAYQAPDDSRLRPVPIRPGRGGFDPIAAESIRAYRFARRRRITVALLAGTVVLSGVGYFVAPTAWAGVAVTGLLLVMYLAYLRRQVRIEDEIRRRRQARLARARQVRPELRRRSDNRGDLSAAVPAHPARRTSSVPPSIYPPGHVAVDLDDDDPAFDQLESYQQVVYRRAAGQ